MTRAIRLALGAMTFAGLAGMSPPLSATDGEVDLRVMPTIARAPAQVNVIVHIPRQADNRLLRVTLDSGGFYRSSDVPLEGDRAAVQHVLAWRDVVAGTYEVVAEVYGPNSRKKTATRPLHVLGFAAEP